MRARSNFLPPSSSLTRLLLSNQPPDRPNPLHFVFFRAMREAFGAPLETVHSDSRWSYLWTDLPVHAEFNRELRVEQDGYNSLAVSSLERWEWTFRRGSEPERTAELWCLMNAPELWAPAPLLDQETYTCTRFDSPFA